jgi:hypothetical protein
MAALLVGYDLNKPAQNYPGLIEQLKEFGTWWHHLDSTWLVKTVLTPVQLRDRLKSLIDANDELLVIDVSGRAAAWTGFNDKASAWIKEHL